MCSHYATPKSILSVRESLIITYPVPNEISDEHCRPSLENFENVPLYCHGSLSGLLA